MDGQRQPLWKDAFSAEVSLREVSHNKIKGKGLITCVAIFSGVSDAFGWLSREINFLLPHYLQPKPALNKTNSSGDSDMHQSLRTLLKELKNLFAFLQLTGALTSNLAGIFTAHQMEKLLNSQNKLLKNCKIPSIPNT